MNDNFETQIINWNGIKIEVRYCRDWSPAYLEVYGHPLANLEIKTLDPERAPLPVTHTGYSSRYLSPDAIEQYDSPAAYVLAWLDHEAQSPIWLAKQEAARQGLLF